MVSQRAARTIVIALIILALAVRIAILLARPELSFNAYGELRQVGAIRESGLPLGHDPLSYGGREYAQSPLYHYLLAAAALIIPVEVALLLIPNLLAVSAIPLAYQIGRRLSRSRRAGLLAALLAATLPALLTTTIHSASPLALFIPLTLAWILALYEIDRRPWLAQLMGVVAIAAHPASIIVAAGLVCGTILKWLERPEATRSEWETVLVWGLFAAWFHLIIYKRALLEHGVAALWANTPASILLGVPTGDLLAMIISSVGLLPLFFGVYAAYHGLHERQRSDLFPLIGLLLIAGVAVLARLFDLASGLLVLATVLAILASYGIERLLNGMQRSKFERYTNVVLATLIVVLVLTSLLPSIAQAMMDDHDRPSRAEREAYAWVRMVTPQDATVLVPVREGFAIEALARRTTVADEEYLLAPDVTDRLDAIEGIYQAVFLVDALELASRYSVDYIMLTPGVERAFNVSRLEYARSPCLPIVYEDEIIIYEVRCAINE